MTLFSIIIPTYNRAARIQRTIHSIISQSHSNFEIIIVNDGSTDNTEEKVKSIQDDRIRYFKKKNEERAIARNFGIQRAQGDYITFLDSDDLVYPNHLEVAQQLIQKYDQSEWFRLGYEIKDENGKLLRKENKREGNLNKQLLTGNHLSCIGVFVRKDIINANLFNDDPEIIGSEDYELWLRLASKYPLYYSNEVTSCIMQHDQRSVVASFNAEKLEIRMKKLIELVKSKDYYNSNHKKIIASHRYLYLSLHLALLNESKLSINYLMKAIQLKPQLLFHRKTLGIIKNLV